MGFRFVLVAVLAVVAGRADAQQLRPEDGVIAEHYELENGMKVILCSLEQPGPISAQFYYDFGQLDDPAGLPQANRVVTKLRERAAIETYEIDEAVMLANEIGITSSDGLPGGVRVRYSAYMGDLNMLFSIEAARMQSFGLDDGLMDDTRDWMNGVLDVLERQSNPPLMTPAISAAAQYWTGGIDHVEMRSAYTKEAVEDLDKLIESAFSPDRATLLVFGGFDSAVIKDVIAEQFGLLEPGSGTLSRAEPTGDAARITWDLDETVVIVAYTAPPDHLANAAITTWGQQLAGILTNDAETKPLLTGIASNQLAYPAGPMPVLFYGRVREGVDPAEAAETLARRVETIVLDAPSKFDFKQLGNTIRMFVGRYIINAHTIDHRAKSLRGRYDLNKKDAMLTAIEVMADDVGLIEIACGPNVRETASLILDLDETQLADILTSTINAENRSTVVIAPRADD